MELLRWIRLQWDRALGLAAIIVGVALLIVGWVDVSATEFLAKQVPYLMSAGLGGIVAVMIGGTLWLSADLRDQWRVLDGIEEALRATESADAEASSRELSPGADVDGLPEHVSA